MNDVVNHPSHYCTKYECIDVMIDTQGKTAVQSFCICNAFKYLYRHGRNMDRIDKRIAYIKEKEGDI